MITDADKVFLPAVLRENNGFVAFCQYYFEFTPHIKQFLFHQARQPNVSWLGSIASGKTMGMAVSFTADCMSLPYFKALTTSLTSVQAEIGFNLISGYFENNKRIEHHIKDIKNRPYPMILFSNGATWTFRTIGYEAKNIRGLEFDRIDFDEACFEPSAETVPTLRGRLRGNRLPERGGYPAVKRMARLDLTSSPADSVWFKEVWYKGVKGDLTYDPKNYLSIRSTIWENKSLSPEHIELMKAGMSDEQIRVELNAEFPDYGDSMFPISHIEKCETAQLNDEMEDAINPVSEGGIGLIPKPGYQMSVHPRHGVTKYIKPPSVDGRYIMAGDPGIGDVPRRNSAIVMCFDTSKYPYEMVYFDWISGHGSYQPFIASFRQCLDMYKPIFKGIDATGTQAALDELAFESAGISTDSLSFQRDKIGMLNALSMGLASGQFRFPVIAGLHRQLGGYKLDDKKLNQDLVMGFAMISYLCRMVARPNTTHSDTPSNFKVQAFNVRGVGRQVGKRR